MRSRCQTFLILVFFCSSAHADLPLTVENLISGQGQVRTDVSITYANVERQSLLAGDPITVQTGPATFVTVPTRVGEELTNTDTTVLTLGLRYGLSHRVELYTRASTMATRQRSSFQGSSNTFSDAGFIDAWAGLNVQLKPDDKTPALLAFAEAALHEKHQRNSSALRSALVGLVDSQRVSKPRKTESLECVCRCLAPSSSSGLRPPRYGIASTVGYCHFFGIDRYQLPCVAIRKYRAALVQLACRPRSGTYGSGDFDRRFKNQGFVGVKRVVNGF